MVRIIFLDHIVLVQFFISGNSRAATSDTVYIPVDKCISMIKLRLKIHKNSTAKFSPYFSLSWFKSKSLLPANGITG